MEQSYGGNIQYLLGHFEKYSKHGQHDHHELEQPPALSREGALAATYTLVFNLQLPEVVW